MPRRVAPNYAADLSVPMLDRGGNAKERKIGSSTMYTVPNYYYYLFDLGENVRKILYHLTILCQQMNNDSELILEKKILISSANPS